MAAPELAKCLRDLPLRIQTGSLKERGELVDSIIAVLDHPEISESIVRGISKLLLITLPRYSDPRSQACVRRLIKALVTKHGVWIQKHLGEQLHEYAIKQKQISASKSTGKTALCSLTWTCILLQSKAQENLPEIVDTQAILLYSVCSTDDKKQKNKANRLLVILWESHRELWDVISNLLTKNELTEHGLLYGSYFVEFLHQRGEEKRVEDLKPKLIEGLVKLVISCKKKPDAFLLQSCQGLLKQINNEEFSSLLLPALQKAMLRAPEIILQGVSLLLSALNLDLSKHAIDLGKLIAGNLHAKDDLARNEAVEACGYLAKRCIDCTALKDLANHLFAVLNGSEGKLTVAQHKISVLQGVGIFSENGVTGESIQQLTKVVVDHLIKVLESEVHEKTLAVALEVLARWSVKFSEVPINLVDCFHKGLTSKSTTPALRLAYIQAITQTYLASPSTPAPNQALLTAITHLLDKAGAGGGMAGQQEALYASVLLLKLNARGVQVSGTIWTAVVGAGWWGTERFLVAAGDQDLLKLVEFCETLLTDYSDKASSKLPQILKAFLYCLVSVHSQVRESTRVIVKRVVSILGGTQTALSLIEEFPKFISSAHVSHGDNKEERESNPHVLVDALLCICHPNNVIEEDAHKIAMASLLVAHHPLLRKHSKNLWRIILKRLTVDVKRFLQLNKAKIIRTVVQDFTIDESVQGALETLVSLDPQMMVPRVVEVSTQRLRETACIRVTRDEYFTYLIPEGEVYDKSVLPGKEQDSFAVSNMKRESKVYSYKDQLEELQLRRELEEKRRKEGKVKEPELTPKQKEIIRQQMEKESAIRSRLQALNTKIKSSCAMLAAALNGSPQHLSRHFKDILPILLENLHSPVAAPVVSELFINFKNSVFESNRITFGNLLAHTTLRVLKPSCDLSPDWESEPLPSAICRIIEKLLVYSSQPLTGPCFCFCFPFLKAVLLEKVKDDDFIAKGLQIVLVNVKIRGEDEDNLVHPKLLPRRQLIILLINLVEMTSKRSQQLACSCLMEVCATAADGPGTYRADADEIQALLSALLNSSSLVREKALRGLQAMLDSIPSPKEDAPLRQQVARRIWVACNDVENEVCQLAKEIWDAANLDYQADELANALLDDIVNPIEVIQMAGAKALAALVVAEKNEKLLNRVLDRLQNIYNEHLMMAPAKVDNLGRVTEEPVDNWEPRRGVAFAFEHLAAFLKINSVSRLTQFFVSTGLADRKDEVQKCMLQAALTMVDIHGKDTVSSLLPIFEEFLDKAPDSGSYDAVRQSVVILMGSLAKHLDKDDPKIKPIVDRLIEALSTPSQQVQEAVANCLPPLVPAIKDDAPEMVRNLLNKLLESDNYGERKGAAYGLAGLVKGMGILALKQLHIMNILTTAIQDKKNYRHREGALFAFEMLCNMLGRLFEPYIVHVLPYLLLCFGDSSQYVRDATEDTARVVMSKLSAHGVKLVLPSLLAALEEDSWRTKTGSIELLGNMAYCAPKQLSSCLPSIVPKLIEVLSDSHIKVQKAGAQALKLIGSVIRNPEIQAIVPVLLQALQDPAAETATSLQTLLDTKFVHFIDAPSLALIMPVVQRAFLDRSTETRKMAAQIIGNMYSLTDQKDLSPYLPSIIPGLKTSLLDPVPEVRSVSARALGAMVRGMGENSFEDLLPWLMQTLTSESSSVDRSGAAQGLSEVVGGLGVEKLHKLMPDIIATAERTDIAPHVKDGYIMMFIYMPAVFTNEFTPYIGQIINPILKALADENEYVRDTALKAGQRIVTLYADSAIMLLLPQLELGLFDDNWRIRYSSVQLLGDLLYRISGVSGKMSTETADEDDNFGTEQSHSAIIDALGAERRNRVLAGLYMGRSDVALMVRQAALHVWKVVVTNTPRTLREILPTLFSLLLGCLASTSLDKRQVAARTLGDLVRKLGERVLPEIIPILERGLESDAADQRQGVCIGLSEIMASTSRDMVLTFVNSLVPTVRKALCDPLPEVRQAAAKTFDSLHATVGVRALDDILPAMLNQLNCDDVVLAESTLDGLRQVMAIKSRVVLPYLVPQLTAPPVNTKALSILASVAGEALTKYLHKILPALLSALSAAQGTARQQEELEYCQAVVLSVTDEVGVRTIMDQLMEYTKSDKVELRKSAATLLCAFCGTTRAAYSQYIPQLIRGLIHLFTDKDPEVLQVSWEALNAVTKSIDPSTLMNYVGDVRQAVRFAVSDLKGQELLPGFCLAKGITPILPIFREAILTGLPDVKEQAAQGLGEVIKLTSAQALQPSVVQITGPLIRIVGDRFNWTVKAAVLETLSLLVAKVGIMVKQFLPQLQTTFVKALNDGNRTVRLKAANALGHLIVIHAKADTIFQELLQGVRTSDDLSIKETMLQALRGVITPAGDRMSSLHRKQIQAILISLLSLQEDTTRLAAAGCLGALIKYLPIDLLNSTVTDHILNDNPTLDPIVRHGRSSALYVALKETPETIYVKEWQDKVVKVLISQLATERVNVAMNAIRSCGYLFQYLMSNQMPLPETLLTPFVRSMNHPSNEPKQLLARICSYLARVISPETTPAEYLRPVIPMLVNGTKEKNGYVKANSELALVAVLGLRCEDSSVADARLNRCMGLLEAGAREALGDVVAKVLKKVAILPEGKEEELDETILI